MYFVKDNNFNGNNVTVPVEIGFFHDTALLKKLELL